MSVSTNRMCALAAISAQIAAPVFRAQGWRWGDVEESPSEPEIAAHIAESLSHLRANADIARTRSGRLTVWRESNTESGYRLGPDTLHVDLEMGYVDLAASDPQSRAR